MRPASRRIPAREFFFLLMLLGTATAISWLSGRTLIMAELFAPALSGIQAATNSWNSGWERLSGLQTLDAENARLRGRIDELEAALWAREEQGRENERLHRLMDLPVPAAARPLLIAWVIGRNPDNWHQRLILDRGTDQGLTDRAVVANRDGLIGRVVTVSPHTALVSLVTDPSSSVSVLNTRTRSAGVMQGQGDAWPTLRFMEQPEKWRVGDRVITSGLGGTDPKGLLVGQIVRVKSATDLYFPELRVQPVVNLDRLEEVVVLPPGSGTMPVPRPSLRPTPKPTAKPSSGPTPAGSAPPSPRPSQVPSPQRSGH